MRFGRIVLLVCAFILVGGLQIGCGGGDKPKEEEPVVTPMNIQKADGATDAGDGE